MREKLIELLSGFSIDTAEDVEFVADYLIANGATIPVRCKDCKHYEKTTLGNGDRCMCNKFLGLTIPKPDDSCSYGERKDNG